MAEKNKEPGAKKDFEPITTAEQLEILLEQERQAAAAKYGDYDDLKRTVAEYSSQIETLSGELSASQTALMARSADLYRLRAATAHGIPYELADRLAGESEEEIGADAQRLAGILAAQQPAPAHVSTPLRSNEPAGDNKTEAMLGMVRSLSMED